MTLLEAMKSLAHHTQSKRGLRPRPIDCQGPGCQLLKRNSEAMGPHSWLSLCHCCWYCVALAMPRWCASSPRDMASGSGLHGLHCVTHCTSLHRSACASSQFCFSAFCRKAWERHQDARAQRRVGRRRPLMLLDISFWHHQIHLKPESTYRMSLPERMRCKASIN